MFRYLQSPIRGTASVGPGTPPPGLIGFCWHFVRQPPGWYALMFATSLAVVLVLIVRPLVMFVDIAIHQNALIPGAGATSMIRWYPAITTPLVGASKPEQLKAGIAAAEFKLAPLLKTRLDQLSTEYRTGDAAR
jgi:hypothetical protein